MNRVRTKARARGQSAFTLVEVALALGIVGFAIVSIFGTLSVGLSTIHDASVDMTNAQIISQVSATLLQTPFDQLEAFASQGSLYFDQAGRQVSSANNPLYRVDLVVNLADTNTYPGAPASLGTSAKNVQVSIILAFAQPNSTLPSSKTVLLVPKS